MRYVVSKDYKVLGTIESGNFCMKDLRSRGEFIVEQPTVVRFPAKFVGNMVVSEDIPDIVRGENLIESEVSKFTEEEEFLIHKKIRSLAIAELAKEGKIINTSGTLYEN